MTISRIILSILRSGEALGPLWRARFGSGRERATGKLTFCWSLQNMKLKKIVLVSGFWSPHGPRLGGACWHPARSVTGTFTCLLRNSQNMKLATFVLVSGLWAPHGPRLGGTFWVPARSVTGKFTFLRKLQKHETFKNSIWYLDFGRLRGRVLAGQKKK